MSVIVSKKYESISKEIRVISQTTGLNPNKITAFLDRFPETKNTNNCRYDLIYSWIRQGAISFKQMKFLIKNLKIRKIDEWVLLNGNNIFTGKAERYPEDFTETL